MGNQDKNWASPAGSINMGYTFKKACGDPFVGADSRRKADLPTWVFPHNAWCSKVLVFRKGKGFVYTKPMEKCFGIFFKKPFTITHPQLILQCIFKQCAKIPFNNEQKTWMKVVQLCTLPCACQRNRNEWILTCSTSAQQKSPSQHFPPESLLRI